MPFFGFREVSEEEKKKKVEEVFSSVAPRYDLMNDLMSAGMHRLWKRFAVLVSGVRPGMKVLDVASGTGDMARLFAKRTGPKGLVVMTDRNREMLLRGRDMLLDEGLVLPAVLADGEALPFAASSFHRVCMAFGLRNMARPQEALKEAHRVLLPGGSIVILEFSRPWAPVSPLYDLYSFAVIPRVGALVAGKAAPYRYLVESIRRHPDQETLKAMMEQAGFERVRYHNLVFGVVAVHLGWKC